MRLTDIFPEAADPEATVNIQLKREKWTWDRLWGSEYGNAHQWDSHSDHDYDPGIEGVQQICGQTAGKGRIRRCSRFGAAAGEYGL
ncbi:MAG: hypothetical protein WBP54_04905 [Pelodictyon phaeoclathratiforme]